MFAVCSLYQRVMLTGSCSQIEASDRRQYTSKGDLMGEIGITCGIYSCKEYGTCHRAIGFYPLR